MPATSVGWALAGVAAGILSGLMGGAVTGVGRDVGVWGFVVAAAVGILALGFLPVTFQWMILRRQVRGRSPVASRCCRGIHRRGPPRRRRRAVGHGERDRVAPAGDFPSAKAWVAFGTVVGMIYGAMTAAVLGRLLRGSARAFFSGLERPREDSNLRHQV